MARSGKPCPTCGGPKPSGRGRKYCDECTFSCTEHKGSVRECPDCQKTWLDGTGKRSIYRERYSEAQSRAKRRKAYNLTDEELDTVLAPGKCATCDNTENLRIDHCHATGIVRGLLCNDCNIALGHVKDSPETLRRLANYLEKR